mmetsp:Transcript_51218/g.130086  ORF Transcript_51218/g.130086 Transcript_51218/m.130086 type:complete len:241 (+) Transcript_51218:431-1153(+)
MVSLDTSTIWEEVEGVGCLGLQVWSGATVALFQLVTFEVHSDFRLEILWEADLVLLLRRDQIVEGPAQDATPRHVHDLQPSHSPTIDFLQSVADGLACGQHAAHVPRRNHVRYVLQVDNDDPILHAARHHGEPQRILQGEDGSADRPLLIPGHIAKLPQFDHTARPALFVPAMPIDEALAQIVKHVGFRNGQALHALLDHRLHHICSPRHIELAGLQHSQCMWLHVSREVPGCTADPARG